MHFPSTNKHPQSLAKGFGENAALLEERLSSVNWKKWGIYYAWGYGIVTVSVVVFIIAVRFALWVF